MSWGCSNWWWGRVCDGGLVLLRQSCGVVGLSWSLTVRFGFLKWFQLVEGSCVCWRDGVGVSILLRLQAVGP
jgi:hypothetical protein